MTTPDLDPTLFPECRQPYCRAAHEEDPTLPCVYWAQTGDIPPGEMDKYLDTPGLAGNLGKLCPFREIIYQFRKQQSNTS